MKVFEGPFGFRFDGAGGAAPLQPDAPDGDLGDAHFVWRHFPKADPRTRGWLAECGLSALVIDALVAEETRPRCVVHGHGAVLNLRGVNLNPGAEPDDMVSVRLWLDRTHVIGVWVRPLNAMRDVIAAIEREEAPISVGDFVSRLAVRLADRAEPYVATLNEQIDDFEESLLDPTAPPMRAGLARLRRSSISLRRYFVPQRDALNTLSIEALGWLTDHDRMRLREAVDRVTRIGEELDEIRDRAQIVHDQIADQRAERTNHQSLVLAVVAAIFLPLSLLTGLLGVNVGGIPGATSPWAFAIVCAVLLGAGVGLFWWMRKLGFFR